MRMQRTLVSCLGTAAAVAMGLSTGCSRVPSPLTPTLHGSVGLPYQGVLNGGAVLPLKGPGYRIIKAAGKNYGTPALVTAIQFAAAEVERQRPGPPLHIGDLSSERGGRIPNHRSHRSGRDADLLFYTTTLGGAPIESAGFVSFGADSLALAHAGPHGRIHVRLDIERNWLLVRSLVTAPSSEMLWIFVARPIEALLTEYAIARGEDPVTVWHAESVMLQPKNALPHDDHFHIRVACSPEESVAGCEDGGPQWPWRAEPPTLDWPEDYSELEALLDVPSLPPL